MIYNYRFDRSYLPEILERIRSDGELSQGWGGGRGENLDLGDDDFVQKCKNNLQLTTTRVPSNLSRIRDFKDRDLLVVPHLPEAGKISLHVISGDFPDCYRYEEGDETYQNHRIKIEKSYGLDGGISVRHIALLAWYGKLQWLRLPILPIPQHEEAFGRIIGELEKNPHLSYKQSGLSDYLSTLRDELITRLKGKLHDVRPSGTEISFEAICESLLVSSGYRIIARNQYDAQGGDVDLHCIRDRSDTSPFEAGETRLFVQVKKHIGNTDENSVQQLLKMIAVDPAADGCVMSLAESFTEKAQELARDNGILLMDGNTICQLLLQDLGKVMDT